MRRFSVSLFGVAALALLGCGDGSNTGTSGGAVTDVCVGVCDTSCTIPQNPNLNAQPGESCADACERIDYYRGCEQIWLDYIGCIKRNGCDYNPCGEEAGAMSACIIEVGYGDD